MLSLARCERRLPFLILHLSRLALNILLTSLSSDNHLRIQDLEAIPALRKSTIIL